MFKFYIFFAVILFLLHIYERIQSRGRDCFGHSKNKCDADSGKGKDFADGKLNLKDLYTIAHENGELNLQSGKQELFENIINQYI